MRLTDLKARIFKLESARGATEFVLRFSDGTTRAAHVRDPLGLLLRQFRLTSAALSGDTLEPNSLDPLLSLICRAESIESPDPLLRLVHNQTHLGGTSNAQ